MDLRFPPERRRENREKWKARRSKVYRWRFGDAAFAILFDENGRNDNVWALWFYQHFEWVWSAPEHGKYLRSFEDPADAMKSVHGHKTSHKPWDSGKEQGPMNDKDWDELDRPDDG